MTAADLVPLSTRAQNELMELRAQHYGVYVAFFPFMVFVGLPLLAISPTIITASLLAGFIALVTSLTLPFVNKSFQKKRAKLLSDNLDDYVNSDSFRNAMDDLLDARSDSFKNPEPIIPGEWRPFRVEYVMSMAIRGDLTRKNFSTLFGGSIAAEACPNFLDMSTILFLKNPHTGKTLRVLIPTQQATRDLFEGIEKRWRGAAQKNTYLRAAINECSTRFSAIIATTSHCDLIDRLAASCDEPFDRRPQVKVQGLEFQPGVVLATAFMVDHEEALALPSGLLAQLTLRTEKICALAEKNQSMRTLPLFYD